MAFHLRGVVLPDDEERDLYVAGDRITLAPLAAAETVVDGGWLAPGLVDVHTHPGAEQPGDPLATSRTRSPARRSTASHSSSLVIRIREDRKSTRLNSSHVRIS